MEELSFMKNINVFDEILKKDDIKNEVRIYCQSMKQFFTNVEKVNASMNETLRKIKDKNNQVN
ncbi:hypothetical protein CHH83_02145 [Bacillus sp. 7586-K]|nr:hypothetical protein CHH83_02145 [Bacillus sp. 7586-K]